jgi:hypothetical protein
MAKRAGLMYAGLVFLGTLLVLGLLFPIREMFVNYNYAGDASKCPMCTNYMCSDGSPRGGTACKKTEDCE